MFPILVLELDLGCNCFVPDLYKLRQNTIVLQTFKLLKMLILEQNTMYYVNGTSHSKILTKGNMYHLLQALQTLSTHWFYKIKPFDQ